MYSPEIKKEIRKRAKGILKTYCNDGSLFNGKIVGEMKYYFRAVRYIMRYGGYAKDA